MKNITKSTIKSIIDILILYVIILIFSTISSMFVHFIDAIYDFKNTIETTTYSQQIFIIQNLLYKIIIIIICLFSWKYIKNNKFSDMGLKKFKDYSFDFIHGLIIGFASITLCFILIFLFGDINISISDAFSSKDLIVYLLLYILVGFSEEIFVRGYMISTLSLNTKLSRFTILLGTSVIFASLHLLNNSITILSFINLFLAGVSFGYIYFCTSSIWLSIGAHITWNFFQGIVYGFNVSGLSNPSILSIEEPVENIINGGNFGMEGSIICTIINIVQIFYIWYMYRNRLYKLLAEN